MLGIPAHHLARYYEIISVFIRYGFGYLFFSGNLRSMQEKNLSIIGRQLRGAFSELGPAFIKLGQLVSTRSDLFPQPIVRELAKLQDQVPPLAFRDIRRVIENSLQIPLESAYREFETVPLAAASIGQVHYAVLQNGEKVAVKVQRPFLRGIVRTDLEIFQALVNQIEQKTPWGKQYPVRLLLEEFSKTIKEELDFLKEGQNAAEISQSCKRTSDILIPKIYWKFTRPSLLTMEYIPGIPLHQIVNSPDTSYNKQQIAARLSKVLLEQILWQGCFHADPHPGNILILPDNKMAFIDFGITGHLSPSMKKQILILVSALMGENDSLLLKALSQMGIVPESIDRTALQTDMANYRHTHFNIKDKKFTLGQSIQDFFAITSRHGIYIPSEFIIIGKALLTLEGVLNTLDPTLSLAEQAKPFSRRFFRSKFALKSLWEKIWLPARQTRKA